MRRLPPSLRQGPRPLPLHLLTHASTLSLSCAVLPLWRNGSLPLRPALAERAQGLRQSLDASGLSLEDFRAALETEAGARHDAFLNGIDAYRRHPYRRDVPDAPVIWGEGSARLRDYRQQPGGVPLLVVPSLINRAYVLDLTAKRSLMRYLAGRGIAPFLLDWDAPGEIERGFTLTDYVAGRLSRALDQVTQACGGAPPALMGYCMGGMLALALAGLRPDAVRGLVLLATPWDFMCGRESHAAMMRALAPLLEPFIDAMGHVPVDLLQSMFSSLDPCMTARKYQAFARWPRRGARARDFVALEDWANDGVPLAGPVAKECLIGWYGANDPAQGNWRIAGREVRPESVRCPALVIIPERDRIVPPASARSLAERIPGAKSLIVKGGHVGMLLSARAKTDLYGPIARWLHRSATQ